MHSVQAEVTRLMLSKVLRSAASLFALSLLMICSGCTTCDRNKNTTESGAKQSQSFYERTGHADRVIVFVHGIFGTSLDTWNCSPEISWPNLLKDDPVFRDSDIYVAGYDTPYLGNRMTIDEIVSNLKNRFDS